MPLFLYFSFTKLCKAYVALHFLPLYSMSIQTLNLTLSLISVILQLSQALTGISMCGKHVAVCWTYLRIWPHSIGSKHHISESSAHKYCALGSEIRNMSESVSSGTDHSKPQASMIPFQNLYLRQYCGTVKNPKHIELSCVEEYIETSGLSLTSASRSIFFMISSCSASPCAKPEAQLFPAPPILLEIINCNLLKTYIFSTIQSGYVCQFFKKHCVEEVG